MARGSSRRRRDASPTPSGTATREQQYLVLQWCIDCDVADLLSRARCARRACTRRPWPGARRAEREPSTRSASSTGRPTRRWPTGCPTRSPSSSSTPAMAAHHPDHVERRRLPTRRRRRRRRRERSPGKPLSDGRNLAVFAPASNRRRSCQIWTTGRRRHPMPRPLVGPHGYPHVRRARRQRQPARACAAEPGPRRRVTPSRWSRTTSRFRRGRLRLPARRVPAHADQLAPDRRRSELHRRRLRGQGPRHRRRARVRGRSAPGARAPACKVALVGGGTIDGFESHRGGDGRRGSEPLARPDARLDDALHVGHHGPAQGRAPIGGGVARRRRRVNLFGYDEAGGVRPPVHRAAVPRRAAGLLAGHAARLRRRPSC